MLPINQIPDKLPTKFSKKTIVYLTALIALLLGIGGLFLFPLIFKNSEAVPIMETKTRVNSEEERKNFYQNENRQSESQEKNNPYLGVPCESKPQVQFTHDFTEVAKIKAVEPTIITVGNSRHRAWLDINTAMTKKVPVYAPVDSELVEGVYKNARGALDYDLHFQVSCEIWYLINHVTDPVDKIKAVFPATPQTDTKINGPFKQFVQVKSGELIGYTTGTPTARNFDFGVFDLNHENPGLPADTGSTYGKEKNFICPFDVFPTELKTAYYSKIISSEKPFTNCK